MKKVIITMIVDDHIREKDIDIMISEGLAYTMIDTDDWEIKIEQIK